jgi:hypothetical protein
MGVPDLSAVQAVLYAALKGAPPLMQLLPGGIFDDVPEDYAVFPYLEIGEWVASPDDASLCDGYIAVLTLRIWARSGGQKAVHQIYGQLRPVLHGQSFAVDGFGTCLTQIIGFVTFKPADGITYPGTVRVQVIAAEQ